MSSRVLCSLYPVGVQMPMPLTTSFNSPLFVVPLRETNFLCSVIEHRLDPISPLPISLYRTWGHSRVFTEVDLSEHGWIAWIGDQGETVGRAHQDAGLHEQRFPPAQMPEKYHAATIAFHRTVLYVGGACGQEVLGLFDFQEPQPEWTPLEVPPELRKQGKEIDDLLVDGNRLLAIDNYSYPKWLLVYDVREPLKPKLVDVREIFTHGPGDHIRSGAVGERWLALLSSTGSTIFPPQDHIALWDRASLREYGHISVGSRPFSDTREKPVDWHHLAFAEDRLLIAASAAGMGILDLASVPRPANPVEPISLSDQSPFRAMGGGLVPGDNVEFSSQCEARLRYLRTGIPAGSRVLRVWGVPSTPELLAVTCSEGGHDTLLLADSVPGVPVSS